MNSFYSISSSEENSITNEESSDSGIRRSSNTTHLLADSPLHSPPKSFVVSEVSCTISCFRLPSLIETSGPAPLEHSVSLVDPLDIVVEAFIDSPGSCPIGKCASTRFLMMISSRCGHSFLPFWYSSLGDFASPIFLHNQIPIHRFPCVDLPALILHFLSGLH